MNTKKIDFVIAWVDGNDPAWQQEKALYDPSESKQGGEKVRFRDWDNLQYWFRGVEKFAPWVNKIHFVTWGHLPAWLNTKHPKLNIVNHRDYIPEEYLPTFNSHTIELNLHRIPGLADQFVYFNDDTFITGAMPASDFFADGRPCDTFALNCIYFGKDSAGFYNGADMEIINDHFRKKDVMKRDFSKWFHYKNGLRHCIKTALLSLWPWFPGFYYQHLPNSFLKSTLCEVWEEEPEVLSRTCRDRFRQKTNVNQWLFKYWQLASGNFVPRTYRIGRCFHVKETNFQSLCTAIRQGSYKMICINDTSKTADFEAKRDRVIEAFQALLPEKSGYEL